MNINLMIIIIIIVIVILILYYNKQKENFTAVKISGTNLPKFNNIINEYNDNKYIKILKDVKVTNKMMVNNVEIKNIILNVRYPIGTYYVQYPENNINVHDDDDIEINDMETMLPKAKSPAILFGGKWEEQFNGDAIFFRTGGPLGDMNRLNGVQQYKMKNIDGCTSIAQTNLWNPGWGSQGVFEEAINQDTIGTDGKPTNSKMIGLAIAAAFIILAAVLLAPFTGGASLALIGVAVAITTTAAIVIAITVSVYLAIGIYMAIEADKAQKASDILYHGNPGKPGTSYNSQRGKICKDRGSDTGVQNYIDPSLQSNVSGYELRPRNRIMKVWKRVG